METKRVFLGCVDIAGQIGDFEIAYRKLGFTTFSFVWVSSRYFKHRYDFVFDELYPQLLKTKNDPHLAVKYLRKLYTLFIGYPFLLMFWLYVVFKNDIFHFFWFNTSYNHFVFKLIKFFPQKKIIVSFVGSDIKWVPSWIQEFQMRNLDHPDPEIRMLNTLKQKIKLESRLRYVRICEKYADMILSGPEQAQLQLRPYFNFYLPVNLDQCEHYIDRKNFVLKVSVGITESKAKGTDQVIKSLKDFHISTDIEFELIILKDLPHNTVIEMLKQSDLFIYTPYSSGAGKFGHEAVSYGAVTLLGYDKEWLKLPANPPFVHIQENTLISTLEYYLLNHDKRIELSKYGFDWSKKWTNPNWIVSDIIDKLHNAQKPEYMPEFFRESATFNSKWDQPNSNQIANKWTKYVSKCDWYKDNIEPGERSGLIF